MAFWGKDLGAQGANFGDPKRKFRFKVEIGRAGFGFVWWAKTCDKPKYNIASAEHQFLNHKFYFPGKVEWQEVNMTLVDPDGDEDFVKLMSSLVEAAGYKVPASSTDPLVSFSKNSMVDAITYVKIMQIDHDGQTIEEWTLKNPILTKAEFGSLEYGSDDLVEVSIGFKYDWAECTIDNTTFYKAGGPS